MKENIGKSYKTNKNGNYWQTKENQDKYFLIM